MPREFRVPVESDRIATLTAPHADSGFHGDSNDRLYLSSNTGWAGVSNAFNNFVNFTGLVLQRSLPGAGRFLSCRTDAGVEVAGINADGSITAAGFATPAGSGFLKANGSVDTTEYLTTADLDTDPRRGWAYFNDMLAVPPGQDGTLVVSSALGAGRELLDVGATNRPGVLRLFTGTTTPSTLPWPRTGVVSPANTAMLLGGGPVQFRAGIRLTDLSTAADRYVVVVGLWDIFANGPSQTDGAYFLYDEGAVSAGASATGFWQTVTTSTNNRTYSQTQTPAGTGWVDLRIDVNADATQAEFRIDDTLVATHTSNVPSSRHVTFGCLIFKTTGTTSRFLDVDYLRVAQQFTTPR